MMGSVDQYVDGATLLLENARRANPAPVELKDNKSTWIVTGFEYKCATCGTTQPTPEMPTTLVCQACDGGGIGSVHAAQRAALAHQPMGWVTPVAGGIVRGTFGEKPVSFECGFCKSTHHYAKAPSSYECRVCGGWPDAAAGSGNDGAIKIIEQPIGSLGTPQKPLRYGPIDGVDNTVVASDPLKLAPPIQVPVSDVEMKFVSGPVTFVDSGGVATVVATVDGLDRYTCWVRWHQNRNSIEGGRGYAIHPLTDAQIVAAKLVQSQLLAREREMNGPPRPSKPKLTILVDQDIED